MYEGPAVTFMPEGQEEPWSCPGYLVELAEMIVVLKCTSAHATVRALEVCVELNLTVGIDYYASLIQLSVFESDRAK